MVGIINWEEQKLIRRHGLVFVYTYLLGLAFAPLGSVVNWYGQPEEWVDIV